ncbi:jg19013 [Pararge aegeria aegeria]|uniref:Jg19013 protein n=1 Tax=Pararge aegeria aegeria TaxID=348720 RepID=A0A8S4QH93_9NEOP|nr:jg19013 [Pararge aegeria aegeria]
MEALSMENLESIEHSISTLTEHFNTRMAEFLHVIQTSIPATSPTSNIAAQFGTFRVFVLSSLESLQLEVQVLSKQCDVMETRKMLLVHGVPEVQKENVSTTVVKVLSQQLGMPEFTETRLSYCRRLGRQKDGKAWAILVKFHDLSIRNQVFSFVFYNVSNYS